MVVTIRRTLTVFLSFVTGGVLTYFALVDVLLEAIP